MLHGLQCTHSLVAGGDAAGDPVGNTSATNLDVQQKRQKRQKQQEEAKCRGYTHTLRDVLSDHFLGPDPFQGHRRAFSIRTTAVESTPLIASNVFSGCNCATKEMMQPCLTCIHDISLIAWYSLNAHRTERFCLVFLRKDGIDVIEDEFDDVW